MYVLTQSALDAYPMARGYAALGPLADFLPTIVLIAWALFMLTTVVRTVLGPRIPTSRMIAWVIVATIPTTLIMLSKQAYESAVLHDTPAQVLGIAQSVTVESGGCARARTTVTFRDDVGRVTIPGKFDIAPGVELARKVAPVGTFVCTTGDVDCARIEE